VTLTPYYDDGTVTLYCADIAAAGQLYAPDLDRFGLHGQAAAVVTSPPYNVGLGYDSDPAGDALAWPDYWALAATACDLIVAALVPGGRAWVNTAVSVPAEPMGPDRPTRRPKRRVLLAHRWAAALETAGLDLVDEIAWASVRAGGCAWGSWQSPASPNLRGDYEAIQVACRGPWEREAPPGLAGWRDTLGGWEGLCSTVWRVQTIGGRIPKGTNTPGRAPAHPAAMPVELAERCIRLSTWPGETVLDPFAGTGSTLLAAHRLGRRAIGIERSERYCALAVDRLAQGVLDLGGAA
jgi:DNA modification methylase